MTRNPLHDVAIVGAYNTRQARVLEGVREIDLVLEAIHGALGRSGGLSLDDVDGLNVRGSVSQLHAREAAHLLGGRPRWIALCNGSGECRVAKCDAMAVSGFCRLPGPAVIRDT